MNLLFNDLPLAVEAEPTRTAGAAQWRGFVEGLSTKGVSQDEIEWSGIVEWLRAHPSTATISKWDVLDYLHRNAPRVEEIILGGPASDDSMRARFLVELTALGFDPDYDSGGDKTLLGVIRRVDGREYQFDSDEQRFLDEDGGSIPDEAHSAAMRLGAVVDSIEALGNRNNALYEQYTLPGGKNYQELLLTIPKRRGKTFDEWLSETGFTQNDLSEIALRALHKRFVDLNLGDSVSHYSMHWDRSNVIAHIRMKERLDVDGKRVLFVEEIQSDWAQEGRKRGFKLSPAEKRRLQPGSPEAILALGAGDMGSIFRVVAVGDGMGTMVQEFKPAAAADNNNFPKKVEPGPYVTRTDKWVRLAVTRVMRHAIAHGFDRVAFTTGAQQVERYRLDGEQGDGMLKFYDSIVPKVVSDLLRKFVGRETSVGPISVAIPAAEEGQLQRVDEDDVAEHHHQPAFEISDSLRNAFADAAAAATRQRVPSQQDHHDDDGHLDPRARAHLAGYNAAQRNEPRIPAQNKECMEIIAEIKGPAGSSIDVLAAFHEGYQTRCDEEAAAILAASDQGQSLWP